MQVHGQSKFTNRRADAAPPAEIKLSLEFAFSSVAVEQPDGYQESLVRKSEVLAKFLGESQSLADLSHFNIVVGVQ